MISSLGPVQEKNAIFHLNTKEIIITNALPRILQVIHGVLLLSDSHIIAMDSVIVQFTVRNTDL